jgi:hypothetical protein
MGTKISEVSDAYIFWTEENVRSYAIYTSSRMSESRLSISVWAKMSGACLEVYFKITYLLCHTKQ